MLERSLIGAQAGSCLTSGCDYEEPQSWMRYGPRGSCLRPQDALVENKRGEPEGKWSLGCDPVEGPQDIISKGTWL